MAVSPQTYTAASPWTASTLASAFDSAMTDAGFTIFDSFLSGTIENRIIRVIYDGAKTYGTTYYWFMFTSSGIFLHMANGWNATTHVPTGTQYLDYYSTATNTTANHCQVVTLSNTVTATITRYTSGVDSTFSWFQIKNGTTFQDLHISRAAPTAFVDLNKTMYSWAGFCRPAQSGASGSQVQFWHAPMFLRRHFVANGQMGSSVNGTGSFGGGSTFSSYGASLVWFFTQPYTHFYNLSPRLTSVSSENPAGTGGGVPLPLGFPEINPAYSSDQIPVFSGLLISLFSTSTLPSDFGIAAYFANNTMAQFDKFIVSAGTNEWEILDVFNASSATGGRSSALFMARTI